MNIITIYYTKYTLNLNYNEINTAILSCMKYCLKSQKSIYFSGKILKVEIDFAVVKCSLSGT